MFGCYWCIGVAFNLLKVHTALLIRFLLQRCCNADNETPMWTPWYQDIHCYCSSQIVAFYDRTLPLLLGPKCVHINVGGLLYRGYVLSYISEKLIFVCCIVNSSPIALVLTKPIHKCHNVPWCEPSVC